MSMSRISAGWLDLHGPFDNERGTKCTCELGVCEQSPICARARARIHIHIYKPETTWYLLPIVSIFRQLVNRKLKQCDGITIYYGVLNTLHCINKIRIETFSGAAVVIEQNLSTTTLREINKIPSSSLWFSLVQRMSNNYKII